MNQKLTTIPKSEWSFLSANCPRNAAQPSKCLKSRPVLPLVFQKCVITVNYVTRQITQWMKYILPPPQWKHSRTELLPSFLRFTGTTSLPPRRVKIRNTVLEYYFTVLEPFHSYYCFQGLPDGRSSVFSYEPFYMYKLRTTGQGLLAGQQRPWAAGRNTQYTHAAQGPALLKNMYSKILDAFNYLSLI